MKTHTRKAFGAAAAIAAIAVSLPLSITAYAEPTPEFPDPQGPGCDAFKQAVPTHEKLHLAQTSTALAAIPDISTFNAAVSGQLNPAVNIVPVLDGGPYVVFAPTNEAFAELPPAQLDALKADPAALTELLYYHMFLGLLGPNDVQGQRPTQEGAPISVTGTGGDITINDTAKVVCGGIISGHARIYTIDTVLDPAAAPEPVSPATTSATETTTTTETTPTTPQTHGPGAAESPAA